MLGFPRPRLACLAILSAVACTLPAGNALARFQDLPSDQVRVSGANSAPGADAATRTAPSAAASLVATSDIPFSRSVAYPTGSQPRTVTAADLNGDGYPDLIVPSNGSNTTLILYGTPDGRYDGSPRATLTSFASNGQKAAVGDFNADGLPDIAVVGFFDGVSVWYQNPDHTFGGGGFPSTSLALGGSSNSGLASGDLNGDGVPDIVAPSQTNGLVRVWLGPGAFGNWTFAGDYSTSAFNSDWVELADVNGDGHLDAIVTDDAPYDRVSILFGTGQGGPFVFSSTATFAVGSGPNTCAVADVNADGRPDILVASWNGLSSFTTMINQGGGSFTTTIDTASFGLQEAEAFAIAAGDVTGDGKIDAVIANGTFGTLSVFPGNGNGTFGAKRSVGVGSAARGVALVDLNGDGRPDVATSNLNANTVQVLLNGASGTYPGAVFRAGNDTQTSFNIDDRLVASLAAGDFNGDGHLDLATVHPAAGTISVMMGAGDGTYGSPTDIPAGSQPQAVVAGDFDRDGLMDLAVANKTNGTVSVLYGKGDGTFKSKINLGADGGTSDVVVADVNGDGRPDLITANATGNTVSVLLKNAGGGGFKDRINAPAGTDPRSVALGDLNGDGRLDMVVADSTAGGFSVLYGTGDGHFTLQYSTSGSFQSRGPTSIALADLDRDGYLDIILSDTARGLVRILRGNGTGFFPTEMNFGLISEPRRITVADIDGDGWPEVLVGARLGQTYVLYPFEPAPPRGQRMWAVGSEGGAVLALDANEDGATDLVTMNARAQDVSVLLNQTGSGASLAAGKPALEGLSLKSGITHVSVSPNPMNPAAILKFTLGASGPLHVRLYDVRGRLVRTLVDESQAVAGERRIAINGTDEHGAPLSTGVYFYRIETDRGTTTGRVTVLK